MWLTSSSIGRKFIMALTGACLVLFVTFHCVMNAIAICWPAAYNVICEFLGANWYALVASLGLAALFVIHIIYALWLTIQNRNARGSVRYSVSSRPADVEWSSKNMLVLGIVVLAFLGVHLIQFWAKMQLQEIRGVEGAIPPAAGTLFIQEAFSQPWTLIVYAIGFVALWFHMNHGFWSMFQSVGWDNNNWLPRLRKIGLWWTSVVIALFLVQGIVFTVKSNEGFYKTDAALQKQYVDMILSEMGQESTMQNIEFADFAGMAHQLAAIPAEQLDMLIQQRQIPFTSDQVNHIKGFVTYIEGESVFNGEVSKLQAQFQMMQQQMMMPQEAAPVAPSQEEVKVDSVANN